MIPKDPFNTLSNGLMGFSGSLFAVITTFQEQIDWYVRFAGAIVGLTIGVISLYRLVRKKK